MLRLIFLMALVGAASDGCDAGGGGAPDCDSWDADYYDSGVVEAVLPPEVGVVAWRLAAEDPGDALLAVSGQLDIVNPTEQDCLVAVYVGQDLGDLPEDLGPIDADAPPPEVHPELGERVLLANLAREWSTVDSQGVWLDLGADLPVDQSITVLGCGSGGVEISLELWADYCDSSEASGAWEDEVHPEDFSLVRL